MCVLVWEGGGWVLLLCDSRVKESETDEMNFIYVTKVHRMYGVESHVK